MAIGWQRHVCLAMGWASHALGLPWSLLAKDWLAIVWFGFGLNSSYACLAMEWRWAGLAWT